MATVVMATSDPTTDTRHRLGRSAYESLRGWLRQRRATRDARIGIGETIEFWLASRRGRRSAR